MKAYDAAAMFACWRLFALAQLFILCSKVGGVPYDVVVHDATSGGITVAVAAARSGASVALLCASWPSCFEEGGYIVGGMSASGLGQSGYWQPSEPHNRRPCE